MVSFDYMSSCKSSWARIFCNGYEVYVSSITKTGPGPQHAASGWGWEDHGGAGAGVGVCFFRLGA